ncbi:MAG: hypothetical protein WBB98_14065, partial [Xanthobacteraceae bacterium]
GVASPPGAAGAVLASSGNAGRGRGSGTGSDGFDRAATATSSGGSERACAEAENTTNINAARNHIGLSPQSFGPEWHFPVAFRALMSMPTPSKGIET